MFKILVTSSSVKRKTSFDNNIENFRSVRMYAGSKKIMTSDLVGSAVTNNKEVPVYPGIALQGHSMSQNRYQLLEPAGVHSEGTNDVILLRMQLSFLSYI